MPQKNRHLLLLCLATSLLMGSCQSKSELRNEQLRINGKVLYEQHCANCHQADGQGLANLYPPIEKEYLTDYQQLSCLIRYGRKGGNTIAGKHYTQAMPANAQLYDLDVAAIITYLHSRWGDGKTVVETHEVKAALANCQ